MRSGGVPIRDEQGKCPYLLTLASNGAFHCILKLQGDRHKRVMVLACNNWGANLFVLLCVIFYIGTDGEVNVVNALYFMLHPYDCLWGYIKLMSLFGVVFIYVCRCEASAGRWSISWCVRCHPTTSRSWSINCKYA